MPAAHFQLGLILHDRGRSQSARTHLDDGASICRPMTCRSYGRRPGSWLLLRIPRSAMGSGAVEVAGRAIDRANGQEVRAFDALAAALAETKDFSAAVDAAEQASTIALARDDAALADAIDQRTRLYRQGLPFRQPAVSVPAESLPPTVRVNH